MTAIKRIVVPTDFSEAADQALDYALQLAKALDAKLAIAHVLDDPFERTLYSEQYVPMPDTIREQILAYVRERLAVRVARSGRHDVTSEILTGPTAKAIVDRARDADLVVMGTHGRHGVAHMLMGSVAERVVRTAPCPVLTVRAPSVDKATRAA